MQPHVSTRPLTCTSDICHKKSMSRGTAAPSAWIPNEESCGANSKSTYSLEQSCSPSLNTQVNEQEISACCSVLELFLEQSLTDTDGLNREHAHFYLSI